MMYPLNPLEFPLHGVRLIEASAGTGKTYTIAALYLRLILGHGNDNGFLRPLTPPEILVVTFTNAATEELRDRIRCRLTEAASFFGGHTAGDDYLTALRSEFAEDHWPSCAMRLERAAQWMDEAAVYTIHAWCQRMLRQHAFDSGGLFDFQVDADDRELLETAACDYWRCWFYPLSASLIGAWTRLTKIAVPSDLLAAVKPFLKTPPMEEAPENPFMLLQKRCRMIEAARQIWEEDFENAISRLRQARADKTLNGNKYRETFLEDGIRQLAGWVFRNASLPDADKLKKLSASGLQDGVSKNKTAPEHPAYAALDSLNNMPDARGIANELLHHAAKDIARRVQGEKQRNARTSFDDLLNRLRNALQASTDGRLAAIIRAQYPVAMIDEFQDTDPVQYAIFSSVYRGASDIGLIMIGDPKQSIYAFRGADVYTYLSARKDAGDTVFTLGTNYRSTEGMVQAVNRMFLSAARQPDGAFLFKDKIPFYEAQTRRDDKEQFVVCGRPVAGMRFCRLAQTEPVSKTTENGYEPRIAQCAADDIARLLNSGQRGEAGFQSPDGAFRPLLPGDIAVLVRTGKESRIIRQALNRRNIPSVYLSDRDSVFDTGEAISIQSLLRACAAPEDASLLRAALAVDILGLPMAWLDRLNRDESAWETEGERFRRFRDIWRHQGVLPMLRALLMAFDVPARLLSHPGGERILTNVLHISELLQTAASRLDGEHALIRWLSEQIRRPDTENSEELVLRLESDEALVRVVTIHKAKGLEYPLVYLPFVCSFREVSDEKDRVLCFHDSDGRWIVTQNPTPDAVAAADRERLAEDLRILYVAATRSRHACWMGVGVMKASADRKGATSLLHRSAIGHLLSGGDAVFVEALPEKLAVMKGDCAHIVIETEPSSEEGPEMFRPHSEAVRLSPARSFSGDILRDWKISSYSGVARDAVHPASGIPEHDVSQPHADFPNSPAEDQLIEINTESPDVSGVVPTELTIHTFPRGPEAGTFLHDLLEMAVTEGLSASGKYPAGVAARIRTFCRYRRQEERAEFVTGWLLQFLKTSLPLPEQNGWMTLAALSPEICQTEMEFFIPVGEVDTRELDRAVIGAVVPGAARPELRQEVFRGMLKGYMDMAFCWQDRYYVLDYKSNYLGENEAAYTRDAMRRAMLEHRYELQYVLYTLALHRLLKSRLPDYDYRRDVGGVLWVFLRGVGAEGQGVYLDKPPQSLIERLDGWFGGAGDENEG
jgi:exodeoxyribonuclease V beta subunit